MAVIGTSYGGGADFYQRKAAQTAEALQMFAQSADARRERRRQRELQEIDTLFKILQQMPELSESPYAAEVVARYGSKYPVVSPIVEAFRKRHTIAQEIPRAGEAWLSKQDELERDYTATQAALQQMPDVYQVPLPTGPFGVGIAPMPNVSKIQAAERLGQVNPALFPLQALEALPPRERAYARIWAESQEGLKDAIPAPFDPFGGDLPVEQMPLEAERVWPGALGPETLEAARVKTGLKTSPAEKEKQSHQTAEREASEEFKQGEREAKAKEAEARIRLQDSLIRGRQQFSASLQKDVAAYQRSLNPKEERAEGAVSSRTLAQDNANAIKDWDYRLQEALKLVDREDLEEKKRQRAVFVRANGPRPKLVPQAHLAAIAKKANAENVTPEQRQALTDGALADYLAKIEAGRKPAQALQEVLSEE